MSNCSILERLATTHDYCSPVVDTSLTCVPHHPLKIEMLSCYMPCTIRHRGVWYGIVAGMHTNICYDLDVYIKLPTYGYVVCVYCLPIQRIIFHFIAISSVTLTCGISVLSVGPVSIVILDREVVVYRYYCRNTFYRQRPVLCFTTQNSTHVYLRL